MEDKVTKKNGTNIISLSQGLNGCFGEENIMKFNNAIKRMERELAADHEPRFRVEKIASNEKATLYAMAYWTPAYIMTDALVHMAKDGDWKATIVKGRVRKEFVDKYIKSIWGYQKKSEVETATELARCLSQGGATWCLYMRYRVSCLRGGLAVGYASDDGYFVLTDFIPYEEIEPEKAKIITKVVLDYYTSGNFLSISNGVPPQLLAGIVGISEVRDESGEVIEYKLNEK